MTLPFRKRPRYLFIIVGITLILLNLGVVINGKRIPTTDVKVEIERVQIIEDRDYGSAEIYLKATVGTNNPMYTEIYRNINDGDTIVLNWVIVEGQHESLTILIEVWESDNEYNEYDNDFLGETTINWDCQAELADWKNCVGAIGGNNQLQAKVYVKRTLNVPLTATTQSSQEQTVQSSTVEDQLKISPVVMMGVVGVGGFLLLFLLWKLGSRPSQPRDQYPPRTEYYSPYQPHDVTRPPAEVPSSKTATFNKTLRPTPSKTTPLKTPPFYCQLCGEKHPAGQACMQCETCARMVCVESYTDMLKVGRSTCPMCGGQLHPKEE